ncbi:MAG TPA: transcriptional repressor [Kiritimatiellia bacterium]|nr:transcriptional repressor [Kiritimatiellia bacterium]HRZ13572.1 transcriptional repressor [Kiritimatiellia bacterium]HSA19332.1 transcriptional repressor [Kiritimatiellia bacterium]
MPLDPVSVASRVEAFAAACRRAGLKTTPQRAEIYRELARTEEHPDAETLYRRVRKRLPSLSLDTVYRTLRMLEGRGIVSRMGTIRERARYDANTERHHHFVCTRCGLVGDFHCEALDTFPPPVEAGTMGRVDSIHVELRGVCRACQQKRKRG